MRGQIDYGKANIHCNHNGGMMDRIVNIVEHTPTGVKTISDIGVWGVAAIGWLGILQPWLTALATILAIGWTCIQIYSWHKKK